MKYIRDELNVLLWLPLYYTNVLVLEFIGTKS